MHYVYVISTTDLHYATIRKPYTFDCAINAWLENYYG